MASLVRVLAEQASIALADGARFQIREDVFGEADNIRRFINQVIVMTGSHVRAHCHYGSLTVYADDGHEGTEVVVASIKQ